MTVNDCASILQFNLIRKLGNAKRPFELLSLETVAANGSLISIWAFAVISRHIK